jgi:hypothetical protein
LRFFAEKYATNARMIFEHLFFRKDHECKNVFFESFFPEKNIANARMIFDVLFWKKHHKIDIIRLVHDFF